MKSVILALTLVVSSAALASGAVYARYDGVSANLLCDAGDTFRTINPVAVCAKYTVTPATYGEDSQPQQVSCATWTTKTVSVAKTTTTCVNYDKGEAGAGCLEYGVVTRSNTSTAHSYPGMGEDSAMSTFSYTIPACK